MRPPGKICRNPGADFWREEAEDVLWEDTVIPMQQSASSEEYAYACDLEIPEEWAAGRIFLRFDGVNCLTRVFVDGNAAGEHYGGFVSWDCGSHSLPRPAEGTGLYWE